MPQDEPRNDEGDRDEPRRRRRSYSPGDDFGERYARRPGGTKESAAVTLLAVGNMVLGSMVLLCGLCGLLVVNVFGSGGGQLGGLGLPGLGGGMALSMLVVLAILSWGIGAIVAGIGMIHRGAWSRLLGLCLAGFAAAVGMLYLAATVLVLVVRGIGVQEGQIFEFLSSFLGTVFFLGHCLWSFLVLLKPHYASEFQ
jgi:hypothetical protein